MNIPVIHEEFETLNGEKSNYYELRKTALRWIQMLSGKEWTDYNAHDPGVTILEVLCYTLTEIEYKLNFSIEEILSSSSKLPFNLSSNALYLAEDILTTAPVTADDYRKLILDRVEVINNAWLIPVDDKDQVYEVLLLKKHLGIPDTKAINTTKQVLRGARGYGATISDVKIAKFCNISLHAHIYLENHRNAEEVLAEMFFKLNEAFLDPNQHRQPFFELEEEGRDYLEIFDGPQMRNGIITKDNLSPWSPYITLVRIKQLIASIPGVEMLDKASIHLKGTAQADYSNSFDEDHFSIEIEKGYVPFFSPDPQYANNDMVVFKNQEPLSLNTHRIQELVLRKARRTKRDYALKNKNRSQTYVLKARDRKLHDYYSIKNDFPQVYGLHAKGYSILQNRKLQNSGQLKAYLMPFEQLLSNSFMQLAHLRDFYAISAVDGENFQQPLNWQYSALKTIGKNSYSKVLRRSQFLTHLLARFDVHLDDSNTAHGVGDKKGHLEKRILIQEKMLQKIVKFTYHKSVFDSTNNEELTSLEEELYLRLGISEPPKRPFYEAVSDLNFKVKKKKKRTRKVKKRNINESRYEAVQIERIHDFTYKKKDIGFHSSNKNILAELLKVGVNRSSYKLISSSNGKKHYVILVNEEGTSEKLISIERSRDDASNLVSSLTETFRDITKRCEGFYLVDHALLETETKDSPFTSFRMSFIFPAWGARFQKRSFQKEVERIVQAMVPAHLGIHCLWLEFNDMTTFEELYGRWPRTYLESVAGEEESSGNDKKTNGLLVDFLKRKLNAK